MEVKLPDNAKGFCVSRSQEISIFHLIIWIFAVVSPIGEEQRRRLRAMYGQSPELIDPLVGSMEEFRKVMKAIASTNKKCVVKVLAHRKLAKKIARIINTAQEYDSIIEIYILNQRISQTTLWEGQREGREQGEDEVIIYPSQIVERNSKVFGYFNDIDTAIDRAEREVEGFTKSFRTFENSACLTGDFERVTRYRFRLVACLGLKPSDFDLALADFRDFVQQTLPWLNAHLKNMGQNGIPVPAILTGLARYEDAATHFMRAEQQRAQREREEEREEGNQREEGEREKTAANSDGTAGLRAWEAAFFEEAVSLYQEEGLFYQLLNSHLRLAGDPGAAWKPLSLPFAHLHRAVKSLYRRGLAVDSAFYTQPFTVFRGGRARRSELRCYEEAVAAGGAFVEFFGFFSTSLSARIVADKFVSARHSRDCKAKDDGVEEGGDEDVVFRISVSPCAEILAAKYDALVHGFYRLTANQSLGDSEKEVLFNALNVFRLTAVRRATIESLFSAEETAAVAEHEKKVKALPTFKYREEQSRTAFYAREVTVVELEFGPFYEALLAQNLFDLSAEERAAKENYVHCMNKVRRFDQFDYGDACVLTQELSEAYAYLKSKVGGSEEELYLSSRTDNKNYFARLSAVCQKLGKTKEALNYSRIAIECYKQLQGVHLNEAYNAHYERLFDMQMRSIEILRESSNFAAAERQLKEQLQIIRGKRFSEPKAKLRESEVYINQAINFYSMGKLEESLNRFAKCEHQLKKTIADFSFTVEPLQCYVSAFFAQLFCPHPILGRQYCYSAFGEGLMRIKRQQREAELVQKHGRKEELQQTSNLAKDLYGIANEAIKNRKSLFKSRKKFTEFIQDYSHQFSVGVGLSIDNLRPKSRKEELEHQIKQKIFKLTGLEQRSQEYKDLAAKFDPLIAEWEEIERSAISTQIHQTSSIWDFIKKFNQKERERKLRYFQQQRKCIIQENKEQLIEYYMKSVQVLQMAIQELKNDGYTDAASSVLRLRKDKAEFYYQGDDRAKALTEIEGIIENTDESDEGHSQQLAEVLTIKAKIHYEMGELISVEDILDEALHWFEKLQSDERDVEIQVSVVSASLEQEQEDEEQPVEKDEPFRHNSKHLEAKLLRLKLILKLIEQKRVSEHGKSRNIYESSKRIQKLHEMHSEDLMRIAYEQIEKLRKPLSPTKQLESDNVGQLKYDFLQIQFKFFMNDYPKKFSTEMAFDFMGKCLKLGESLGDCGFRNSLLCCEFIFKYFQNQYLLRKFMEFRFIEHLKGPEIYVKNCNFLWKIQKALFLIYQQEGQYKAIAHLEEAVRLLEAYPEQKKDQYLKEELDKLRQELRKYRQASNSNFETKAFLGTNYLIEKRLSREFEGGQSVTELNNSMAELSPDLKTFRKKQTSRYEDEMGDVSKSYSLFLSNHGTPRMQSQDRRS